MGLKVTQNPLFFSWLEPRYQSLHRPFLRQAPLNLPNSTTAISGIHLPMNNNDTAEEQLLQDASTLLMFASAAAKQQHQPASQHQMPPKKGPQSPAVAVASEPVPKPHLPGPLPGLQSLHQFPHLQQPLGGPQPPQQGSLPHLPAQDAALVPPIVRNAPKLQISSIINATEALPHGPQRLQKLFDPVQDLRQHQEPLTVRSLPESKAHLAKSLISEQTSPVAYAPPVLPAQGSFSAQSHKRLASTPSTSNPMSKTASQSPPLFTHKLSPGPANVVLARGINTETGKRNNSNAVIAAAALAAAADNPLPPLNKKHKDIAPRPLEQSPNAKLEVPVPKVVDSVVTEPEDEDLNQTEDEQSVQQAPLTKLLPPAPVAASNEKEKASDIPNAPKNTAKTEASSPILPVSSVLETASQEPAVTVTPKVVQNAPPLEQYQVDPDSGLIGCICGIDDDDGFTVQCDICFRWQHCLCMNFTTAEEIPEDEYKCYYCDENKWGKFDPEECRANTIQRLENEKNSPANNDTASDREPANTSPEVKFAKRKHSNSQEDKKRRRIEKADNGNNATQSAVASNTVNDPPANERRKSSQSRDEVNVPYSAPPAPVAPPEFVMNKDNELLDGGVTAESYQSVYYKLKCNDYKRSSTRAAFDDLGSQFFLNFLSAKKERRDVPGSIEVLSLLQFKNIKFSRLILPNNQKYLQERNEIKRSKDFNKTSIQVKSFGENPKQKFSGISRLGLFITERFGNGQQEVVIEKDTPIIEYLGEIDFFENYRNDKVNQYHMWGTTKPKVLKTKLAFEHNNDQIDIVMDSRFVGNESRFIRRACPDTANCVIKPFYIPQLNSFRFIVVTSRPIRLTTAAEEEELRLNWEWDEQHPILRMYNGVLAGDKIVEGTKFEDFTDDEKTLLIAGVDNILHFIECGCTTSPLAQQCAIYKIKKATAYLLRSTRKASSISNINLAKSREELIIPKKPKSFVSWNERLIQRDEYIQMSLSVSTSNKGEDSEAKHTDKEAVTGDFTQNDEKGNMTDSVKKYSFTAPFKQQLILKSRNLRKEVHSARMDTVKSVLVSDLLMLAIPIIPDLVARIQKTAEETVRPGARVPAKPANIALNEKKVIATPAVPIVAMEVKEKVQKDDGPKQPSQEEVKETKSSAPVPPPVVKKLSFADYKKKMK